MSSNIEGHPAMCGQCAVRASLLRILRAALNAAPAKNTLCGGCGKRYSSPSEDGAHGFGKCVMASPAAPDRCGCGHSRAHHDRLGACEANCTCTVFAEPRRVTAAPAAPSELPLGHAWAEPCGQDEGTDRCWLCRAPKAAHLPSELPLGHEFLPSALPDVCLKGTGPLPTDWCGQPESAHRRA